MRKMLAVAALSVVALPVWGAQKTVTLSVPTMDCAVCPITVKKAIRKVTGVTHAEVNFEKREAIVTFDDTKAGVEALLHATKNAGYPSMLAKSVK